MADYYPLLSRALEALPDRSPALRKAVYDRARSALIGQLRSLEPPIPEADIDLERQALDSAIARLEVDYGGSQGAAAERLAPPGVMAPPVLPEPEPPTIPAVVPEAEPLPFREAEPVPSAEAETPAGGEAVALKPGPEPEPPAVSFVPPVRKAKSPKPNGTDQESQPIVPEAEPATPTDADVLPQADVADVGNGRQRPKIDVVAPRAGRSRLLRNAVVGGLLLVVIGAIAVAAFMLRDQPAEMPEAAENGQEVRTETQETKFTDRVGGEADTQKAPALPPDGPPAPAAQQEVMVAQRAVLYEENASDPKAPPNSSTGRVTWRLEPVNGEQGEPLQNAVRANVEFPDAGLTLAMTIKRNHDTTLPASHTVELAFTNFGKGEQRGVQDIGLLQLKDDANGRGSPVSGLPVRVRDNLFLIGLSNLPNDIERNTDLLLRKNWLDLALKYKTGQRAILAFDKGNAGTQVMQSALDQWRQQ